MRTAYHLDIEVLWKATKRSWIVLQRYSTIVEFHGAFNAFPMSSWASFVSWRSSLGHSDHDLCVGHEMTRARRSYITRGLVSLLETPWVSWESHRHSHWCQFIVFAILCDELWPSPSHFINSHLGRRRHSTRCVHSESIRGRKTDGVPSTKKSCCSWFYGKKCDWTGQATLHWSVTWHGIFYFCCEIKPLSCSIWLVFLER